MFSRFASSTIFTSRSLPTTSRQFSAPLFQKCLYSTKTPIPNKNSQLNILIHGHTFEAFNAAILLAPYHKVTLSYDDLPTHEAESSLLPPQIPYFFQKVFPDVYNEIYHKSMHRINEVRCRSAVNSHYFDLDMDKVTKRTVGNEFSAINMPAFQKYCKDLMRHKRLHPRQKKIRAIRETEDGVYVRSGASGTEEKFDFVIGADGYNSKVKEARWPTGSEDTLPLNETVLHGHNNYITLAVTLRNSDVEYADILFDMWSPSGHIELFSCFNEKGDPRIGILVRMKMDTPDLNLGSRDIAAYLSQQGTKVFVENGADILLEDLVRVASMKKIEPGIFTANVMPAPTIVHDRFVSDRVALIGQAAHVCSPILGMNNLQNFYDAHQLSIVLNESVLQETEPDLRAYEAKSKAFHSNMINKTSTVFKQFDPIRQIGFGWRMKFIGRSGIRKAFTHVLTVDAEK